MKTGNLDTETSTEGRQCEDTQGENGHIQAKERSQIQMLSSWPWKEPSLMTS